jgi:hypothetical protein
LPVPQDVVEAEGHLAYRTTGVQADPAHSFRLRGLVLADFLPLWQKTRTENLGLPERAYHFRRSAAGEPFLQLNLQAPSALGHYTQEITWQVGPRQAEVHATAQVTAPGDGVSLVEWEIPTEVVLADLRGPDVWTWSRTGSRVQVWLQRSPAQTTLALTGWVRRRSEQPAAPFSLPCLRLIGTAPRWTLVRILGGEGLAVSAAQLRNLWNLPTTQPSDLDVTFWTKEAMYGGIFHIRPAAAQIDVRVLTLAEAHDRSLTVVSTVDCQVRQGELRTLTVALHNWEGQDVALEAPQVIKKREQRRAGKQRAWILNLQPGITERYRFKITSRISRQAATDLLMPDVRVEGAGAPERWLAVAGPDWVVEELRGLLSLPDLAEPLKLWTTALNHLRRVGGSAWKVTADDWKLRLGVRAAPVEAPSVQVFLDEQAAALSDGRRWLHQAAYWLRHRPGTDLNVQLPVGARLVQVSLDGNEVVPLQPQPGSVWLPLTGGSGIRRVRLSWIYDADRERFDQPNLARPWLEDVAYAGASEKAAPLWTVQVPPGYHLVPSDKGAVPDDAAGQDLRHAAAHLHLSRLLAEQATGQIDAAVGQQLLAAQEDFYRSCRYAEYRLAFVETLEEKGYADADLAGRLRQLQADNQQLAQRYRFESLRSQAENRASRLYPRMPPPSGEKTDRDLLVEASGDLLVEEGIPTYWQAGAGMGVPHLRLVAVGVQQTQKALGLSGLLVILVLLAWIVSYFPRIVAWVQAFWPEEMVFLGCLGWLWLGHLAFPVLCVVGIVARLIYLGRWGLAFLHKPTPATPSTGSGSAASS